MKHLILWATFALPLPAMAEFPSEKVAYICDTAAYYYTTPFDDCILEQYGWHSDIMALGLTDDQYANALWYGQKYGYLGEVKGIDFKPVLERANYLKEVK